MERIILFGGSFDPIHNGHLRLARGASFALNASVIFIPSKSPRWKNPTATVNHRLEMLKIALKTEGCTDFSISDYELNKNDEINYTIDTVRHFSNLYPDRELILLIGADQVNRFHEWKSAIEIAHLCKIAFVKREGFPLKKENIEKYNMIQLNINGIGDVSSSKIRNLQSLDMPVSVLEYIEDHSLYYIEKIKTFLDSQRFLHSLEVAHLSYLITKSNHFQNPEKGYIAGLLHDIGKHYEDKKTYTIMKDNYSEYLDMPSFSYHQFIGEYIAREYFEINDSEILDAIEFHATGKANMSELGKVVYVSDKIEPTRGYNSTPLIRACIKNIDKGFIKVLEANRKHLIEHNKDIYNKLTNDCMMQYLMKGK